MACETICKPVDEKLEDIWKDVKCRPTSKTFYLILGGMGGMIVVFLYFLWGMKGDMSTAGTQLTSLVGSVEVVKTQLVNSSTNMSTFVNIIDRENQRQDSRIQRLEDRIESFHKGGVK
jgi:hypothetical protein